METSEYLEMDGLTLPTAPAASDTGRERPDAFQTVFWAGKAGRWLLMAWALVLAAMAVWSVWLGEWALAIGGGASTLMATVVLLKPPRQPGRSGTPRLWGGSHPHRLLSWISDQQPIALGVDLPAGGAHRSVSSGPGGVRRMFDVVGLTRRAPPSGAGVGRYGQSSRLA